MSDAWRIGFLRRRSYAETRRKELRAALAAARADPRNLKFYNVVDSSAAEHLTDLCDRLIHDLAGVAIVITHAYEGGHPDHDACAFAVQVACTRLGAAAPLRLEFAGYTGRRPPGEFWPDSRSPEVVVPMTVEEQRLKQAALAAHATKKLTWFPTTVERYRKAPLYDFTRPPTDEEVSFGQSGRWISGETWRKHASRALERLGQEQP
jgi:LmbE family N-acetylglucosaminyl deacetylase